MQPVQDLDPPEVLEPGTPPNQTTIGLGIAQVVPALVGLTLGGAVGVGLFHALSSSNTTTPPATQLVALAAATVVLTVVLTALPARLEARRPIVETLRET